VFLFAFGSLIVFIGSTLKAMLSLE
jgi:hypothetical protein